MIYFLLMNIFYESYGDIPGFSWAIDECF